MALLQMGGADGPFSGQDIYIQYSGFDNQTARVQKILGLFLHAVKVRHCWAQVWQHFLLRPNRMTSLTFYEALRWVLTSKSPAALQTSRPDLYHSIRPKPVHPSAATRINWYVIKYKHTQTFDYFANHKRSCKLKTREVASPKCINHIKEGFLSLIRT